MESWVAIPHIKMEKEQEKEIVTLIQAWIGDVTFSLKDHQDSKLYVDLVGPMLQLVRLKHIFSERNMAVQKKRMNNGIGQNFKIQE